MDSILDLVKGSVGQQLIGGLTKQLGMDNKTASTAISAALPLVLGALKNNASSNHGASGLFNALSDPRHQSGRVVDQLGHIVGGAHIDRDVIDDGDKILGHLFGSNKREAAHVVSKSSGIDVGKALNILQVVAPLVMGFLGNKAKHRGVNSPSGIGDLLGAVSHGLDGNLLTTAASLIQGFSKNDSTVDDIAGMILGGGGHKQGGGLLGNILGGLFKG